MYRDYPFFHERGGNGSTAIHRGFFPPLPKRSDDGCASKRIDSNPYLYSQNVLKKLGLPCKDNSYRLVTELRGVSGALQHYAAQHKDAVVHPTFGFRHTLNNQLSVIGRMETLLAGEDVKAAHRNLLSSVVERVQRCKHGEHCGIRFCALCQTEYKLMVLDQIANLVPEDGPIPKFRFVTILGNVVYGTPNEVRLALELERRRLHRSFCYHRRQYPDVYQGIKMLLVFEIDILPPFYELLGGYWSKKRDYWVEWERCEQLAPRNKRCMIEAGYDPGQQWTGFFITMHGVLIADTDDQIERLRRDLTTSKDLSNGVQGDCLYPRAWQLQFKRLYTTKCTRHNLNSIVGYMFKNVGRCANYVLSEEALKAKLGEGTEDLLVPGYGRKLPDYALRHYIRLSRDLTFSDVTVKIGFRGNCNLPTFQSETPSEYTPPVWKFVDDDYLAC